MAAQQRTYFVDQLNDPEYINWLKASRALQFTVDGLRRFCQDQMKNFHQTLLLNIKTGETPCTVPCSHACRVPTKNPIRISWPDNVCLKWLDGIFQERSWVGTPLTWKNSDISQWPKEPWQLAKVYMDPGREDSSNSAADTDPSGILNLIVNCKRFGALFEEIRKVHAVSSRVLECDVGLILSLMIMSSNRYSLTHTLLDEVIFFVHKKSHTEDISVLKYELVCLTNH